MKLRSIIFGGALFGLAAVTLLRAAPGAAPKVPPQLTKAKVDAARRTYEVIWKNNKEGLVPFAELAYRWSRRWLEAEVERSEDKANQLAAYTAHRDRMRELARITRDRYRNRVITIEEASATDFYLAEAVLWIEQAKNR
jgi:hypothetical protein